jgi:tellurite methyltransferase
MSVEDAKRWNDRYDSGAYEGRDHPTVLLGTWLDQLPRGRALDLACGAGRNALFLARNGFEVDAMDVSDVALKRAAQYAQAEGLGVNWQQADLDEVRLPVAHYQLVVVSRFLDRRLFPALADALAPGGYLVYETHLATQRSDVGGPGSNRFRLQPGELLNLVHTLRILHYHEGLLIDPDGPRMVLAQCIACKGQPAWDVGKENS